MFERTELKHLAFDKSGLRLGESQLNYGLDLQDSDACCIEPDAWPEGCSLGSLWFLVSLEVLQAGHRLQDKLVAKWQQLAMASVRLHSDGQSLDAPGPEFKFNGSTHLYVGILRAKLAGGCVRISGPFHLRLCTGKDSQET